MAYPETVLRRAQARLREAREDRQQEDERRRSRAYAAAPRVREIDLRLRATVAEAMCAGFRRGEDPRETVERVKAENLSLQRERARLLEELGIDSYPAPPACPVCGDSGYIGARMCECLRALCREEQTRELTTLLPGPGSFESFRLDLYPDARVPKLGASPRALMGEVYTRCRRYAEQFSTASPSLLFSGGPGLGKTFLSAAIARTVAERGCSVAYESAGQVFSDFEREKFGGAEDLTRKYLSCDLLILDDLGTELTNQFTCSALYTLLNGRIRAGLPVLVSTNLTTAEIRLRYTPQISSRLLGCCTLLLFFGDDLRQKLRT